MKISSIKVKNLKKIINLDIDIPEDNQVICFVGENGSNKSSLITYLYQLIRRTTIEKSPSDEIDHFVQGTFDVSQVSKSPFYFVKVFLKEKEKTYYSSEASVASLDDLTPEDIAELKGEYGHQYKNGNQFFKDWSKSSNSNDMGLVKNNVLLFRPSNRMEIPSYEKNLEGDNVVLEPVVNVVGQRKFPFRVERGIEKATNYFLDVLLDYFIDMNRQKPSFSLYGEFMAVLRSIDEDFQQLTVSKFPNKSLATTNLPSLNSLSSGQSDWLVTAINILVQISEISSANNGMSHDPYDISGIVFIDEVDKNYHPKLQEEIIPWFTSKFKKIQFVISTHSPYLIRSLAENSVVVRLPEGEVMEEDFSYWDISEVANKIFNRSLGFSKKVIEEIGEFTKLLRLKEDEAVIRLYVELSGKSESLRQELNRLVYTLASKEVIERINEKS